MSGSILTIDSIAHEETRASELDLVVKSLKEQIQNHLSTPSVDPNYIQFRVSSAENKLHEIIVRFNQAIAENTDLKSNIELLRKEKSTFHSIHSRLIKEVAARNSDISEIIDKSNADYSVKDSVQEQMAQLRAQAEKEHVEFQKEWSELARLIENDKKMRDFVQQREILKNRKETMKKLSVPASIVIPDPTVNEAELVRMKEKLSHLQSVFESIRMATGVSSIEELLVSYTNKEKHNFSLFNKTNMDMSALTLEDAKIEIMRKELTNRRGLSGSNLAFKLEGEETEQNTIISNIEKNAEEFGVKLFMLNKLICSIRVVVQSVFEKVFKLSDYRKYMDSGVVAASVTTPIGTVTEANIIDYLAAIESSMEDLTRSVFFEKHSTPRKSVAVASRNSTLLAPQATVVQQMMHFRLPSAIEDDDSEDTRRGGRGDESESLRPLTRNELRAKTLENMQRSLERGKNKKIRS